MVPCISVVIISTYNWPAALELVLLSLKKGSVFPHEVIIADDGSSSTTKALIRTLRPHMPFSLEHVWQEDKGFRVSAIRNKAIVQARGNYLVFLDQDTIPRRHFIKNHLRLAQSNYFVSGSRVFFNEALSQALLNQKKDISSAGFWWFLSKRLAGQCNRCLPLLSFPFDVNLRKIKAFAWEGVRNLLGVWKTDLMAINGYDESFQGWGYEDTDLAVRLLYSGIKRKLGHFSIPVMHLHHEKEERVNEKANNDLLMDTVNKKRPVIAVCGIEKRLF